MNEILSMNEMLSTNEILSMNASTPAYFLCNYLDFNPEVGDANVIKKVDEYPPQMKFHLSYKKGEILIISPWC